MDRLTEGAESAAAVRGFAPLELGQPWPMGASFDGEGVNFAVFSAHASQVDLCLFDDAGLARADAPAPCPATAATSGMAACHAPDRV